MIKSLLKWLGLAGVASVPLALVAALLVLHKPAPAPDDGGAPALPSHLATGWIADPDAVEQVAQALPERYFRNTPACDVAADEIPKDVFLWETQRKATGDLLPPRNQNPVGSCVGFGTVDAVETSMCVQISLGAPEEFKALSQEIVYAGSRVQVGKGRIRGDGSVGAWAAQFVKDWGVVARGRYPGYDLSEYNPTLCRSLGLKGCPPELVEEAKKHPVKGIAQVRNAEEARRALASGYPIAVCSNQGFSADRDADGFCRAQGSWAHCMSVLGYQTSGTRKGFYIRNSWGTLYHRGPVGAGNPSPAGFWAEWSVVDRMFAAGDSWAFSDVKGFPARKIDWFAQPAPVGRPATRLPAPRPGRADREPHFALAP